jgi:hypothetical protein
MFKYFDRAFFHFFFGFVGMITVGFIILMAVGYYEVQGQNSETASIAQFQGLN